MPPRQLELRQQPAPGWNTLLIGRPGTPRPAASTKGPTPRGPASLAEALHRFVDRNWD